jgi:hypothetical protein
MLDDYFKFLSNAEGSQNLSRILVGTIKVNNYYDARRLLDVAASAETFILPQICQWKLYE